MNLGGWETARCVLVHTPPACTRLGFPEARTQVGSPKSWHHPPLPPRTHMRRKLELAVDLGLEARCSCRR